MNAERTAESPLETHKAAGTFFEVRGLKTFRLDQGTGEVVVCLHGVPTSSFLYRKVIKSLKDKGYRGICIDLPGLGFTDRPEDFDYSFQNLADFLFNAIESIGLQKFHLVVHDIGGPIGFALAARHQSMIRSLSILNSWIDVVNYEKPLMMKPFEKPVLGEAELKMVTPITWPVMFKNVGVLGDTVSREEMNSYVHLLKREDEGKAFLKIMRNFPQNTAFRDLCYKAVQNVPYPVQAIWGEKDPALTYERYGKEIKKVANLETVTLLPSRHLLQEEVWMAIADKIDEIILSSEV